MSASDVLHPDGSDYDAFLLAEVGEDRTGAAVTVLSALTRLDVEPWTEARELSSSGPEDAQVRLMTHFEAIADIPALALASEGRAAKLVSLLPAACPASRFKISRSRHQRFSKTFDFLDIDGLRWSRGSNVVLLSGSDGLTYVSARTQRIGIDEPVHRKSWWYFPSILEVREAYIGSLILYVSCASCFSDCPGKDIR